MLTTDVELWEFKVSYKQNAKLKGSLNIVSQSNRCRLALAVCFHAPNRNLPKCSDIFSSRLDLFISATYVYVIMKSHPY